MATYQEILDKVPQSVKDKFLIKKRERAIEIVKEKISNSGKSISDFDDDEMEGMIADEEQNLKSDQLKTILFSLLTAEGLSYLANLFAPLAIAFCMLVIFLRKPPKPACTTGRPTIPPDSKYLIVSLGSIILFTKPPKAILA